MKQFRNILTIVSIVASFIANAGEQSAGKAKGTVNQPIAAELQPLQGTWEGVLVGDKERQKITHLPAPVNIQVDAADRKGRD